ncbi:hypothetical protein PT274_05805 [Leuconostocaceae bacterium ESL0958]|nr:hypothetical protein [Leuconostocaceae bacterium ESL0958]
MTRKERNHRQKITNLMLTYGLIACFALRPALPMLIPILLIGLVTAYYRIGLWIRAFIGFLRYTVRRTAPPNRSLGSRFDRYLSLLLSLYGARVICLLLLLAKSLSTGCDCLSAVSLLAAAAASNQGRAVKKRELHGTLKVQNTHYDKR